MRFLPRDALNNKGNVIYVARNPKDAAVSYYHFCIFTLILPTYNWDDFVDNLCEGKRELHANVVYTVHLKVSYQIIHVITQSNMIVSINLKPRRSKKDTPC